MPRRLSWKPLFAALAIGSAPACAGPPLPPAGGGPAPAPAPASTSTYTVEAAALDPDDHDYDGIGDDHDLCAAHEEDGKGNHPWDGCPDARDPARGAALWAALPKQAVKLTKDRIEISEEIRFALSSATIDPSSETLLQSIAQVLKDVGEIELVEIAGHADEQGSDEKNKRLTEQRATSVMKDLTARGVDATRLRAVGYSSYCTIDPGKDEAARARNRRVEMRILRRAGQDLEPRWGGCAAAEKRGMRPLPLPKLDAEETERRRAAASVRAGCATEAERRDCAALCGRDHVEACLSLAGVADGKPKVTGAALFDAAERACKKGGLDACPLAARHLREGQGAPRDPRRALELLATACGKGGGASCTAAGAQHDQGLGTSRDAARAFASWQRGCGLGDAAACVEMAGALWSGRGEPKDPARAMEAWVIGCELGSIAGCKAVGDRYKEAPEALRARDRALAALHVACDQDPAGQAACDAIPALGEKPGEFRPVRVCAAGDYKACLELCRRDAGAEACIEFGIAELYGIGVRRSAARAAERFAAACGAGRARGCALAPLLHEARGDHVAAAEGYHGACARSEQAACVNRARLEREGLGTYRDQGSAARALEAACQNGSGIACAHLSRADEGRAPALLAQACGAGFKPACPSPP